MRNILLICAGGMSTSMLMTRMQDYAKSVGYECTVQAHAVSKVAELGPAADIILLGPQIRYELSKVKGMFPDKPVEAIDMTDYGMMRGENVIKRVRELLGD